MRFATMQSGALLVLTCLFMSVCTYGVGTLPLAFQLSRHSLRKLELWGAGLLLGQQTQNGHTGAAQLAHEPGAGLLDQRSRCGKEERLNRAHALSLIHI